MRRILLALALSLTVSGATAQQAPPRDRPQARVAAAGTIRGRVVSTDGSPVRGAEVKLTALDSGRSQQTATGEDGRYAFTGLTAGRYGVRASKAGFITFGYGQKVFNGSAELLTVGAGEELPGIDITLPRGSAISGRITNEFGEPVTFATVRALRYSYTTDGRRTLQLVGGPGPLAMIVRTTDGATATTDDLGRFRLFALQPGEYVVAAMIGPELTAGPSGGGIHLTADETPPTYYPGTNNPAEAVPVTLGVAEEASIQLQLLPLHLSRVSGIALDSHGAPVRYGAPLSLVPASGLAAGQARSGNVGDGGQFAIDKVTPGDYVLRVRPLPVGPAYPAPTGPPEIASLPVTVAGNDVQDLRLVTRLAGSISGRIVVDGGSMPSIASMEVNVTPAELDPFGRVATAGRWEIKPDGTFDIPGIMGPVTLTVQTPIAYTVKSVTADGADVTDTPFDPTQRDGTVQARVVLTDRVTVVSGTIPRARLDTGGPAIVIVPDAGSAATSRSVRSIRPDADGQFEIRGLPPGRYSAVAFDAFDGAPLYDPQFQSRVRAQGRLFSLREGERLTLDVPLASGW